MRIAFFSTKSYDRDFFTAANVAFGHEMVFLEARLALDTAPLARDFECVCLFVNDKADRETLVELAKHGVKLITLRSAGFNHVDLAAAQELGIKVVRVPAYSPHAVAEHTLGLLLSLNRKIHRAYNRVREGNFSLEGLLGFDVHGLTIGIIGTGKIGEAFARIMQGFGCRLLAYDPYPNEALRNHIVEYVELEYLFRESDILSLHCPLTPDTFHLINPDSIGQMRNGVMIINTSRGAIIDTKAVIGGLKSGRIGHLALDVYEEEADLFFEDLSSRVIQDDVFSRLVTFPNVLITGHQAFFTRTALKKIADTTLGNVTELVQTGKCKNEVGLEKRVSPSPN